MKRTPITRKRAKPRRTTSPRCANRQCNKRAEIRDLCVSHAEQRADAAFSIAIRNRDACCTAAAVLETSCIGVLQAAHIVGRRNQSVRYDPANVHTCCAAHHMTVDQAGQEHAKVSWAVSILGEEGYWALMARASVMGDRREAIRTALGVDNVIRKFTPDALDEFDAETTFLQRTTKP